MQRLSDKPLTRCPKCKGRLEKLLSAPAIQFKGSGWYVTDYAGKKLDGAKDGAEEKKAASTESSTTEPKSASKETSSKKKDSHALSPAKTKSSD